jgi:hypothetical protein
VRGRTEFRGSRGQRGQAITEYILLLTVILIIFLGVLRVLKEQDIFASVAEPVNGDFASAYKYGHPKAKGYDEGKPINHPRIEDAENFRLYLNPRTR